MVKRKIKLIFVVCIIYIAAIMVYKLFSGNVEKRIMTLLEVKNIGDSS